MNEFHAMTLATGNPESEWSTSSIVAFSLLILLLVTMLVAVIFYVFRVRNLSKAQIAQMEQYIGPVKKRVKYLFVSAYIYLSLKSFNH